MQAEGAPSHRRGSRDVGQGLQAGLYQPRVSVLHSKAFSVDSENAFGVLVVSRGTLD